MKRLVFIPTLQSNRRRTDSTLDVRGDCIRSPSLRVTSSFACFENTTGEKMWIFHRVRDPKWMCCVWSHGCLRYAAIVCLLFAPVRTNDACPWSCICATESGTVTCRDGGDTEVPGDVPKWTSTMIITGRNVSTLQRDAFATNGSELQIVTLSLSHNGIRVIEAYAFLGLPRLHLLDLSHNQLESISDRAFHALPELRSLHLNYSMLPRATAQLSDALSAQSLRNLHRLELTGNGLKTIPLMRLDIYNLYALVLVNNSIETLGRENVTNLYQQRRVRVYLSLNPFRCNCDLGPFYYWLKNSSQCPDAAYLECSEPDTKRGAPVEKLRVEDVDCASENLEAVSYVFLGIVLALIGVVFLMVLYLNRGGIKRWLNNIREACRDQMEVYHYRYEQDSDPRLANVAV